MTRRMLVPWLSLVALAALATVPGVAFASPEVVQGGTRLPTGTGLSGIQTRSVLFETSNGTFTCTSSQLGGELKVNNGKLIEAQIVSGTMSGSGTEGGCIDPTLSGIEWKVGLGNLPWCLASPSLGAYKIRGGGCNEAAKPVTIILAGNFGSLSGTCTYTRSILSLTSNAGTEPLAIRTAESQEFLLTSSTWTLCHSSFLLNAEWEIKANGMNVKVQ